MSSIRPAKSRSLESATSPRGRFDHPARGRRCDMPHLHITVSRACYGIGCGDLSHLQSQWLGSSHRVSGNVQRHHQGCRKGALSGAEVPTLSTFARTTHRTCLSVAPSGLCRRYKIRFYAFNPLAGGMLTGKHRAIASVPTDGANPTKSYSSHRVIRPNQRSPLPQQVALPKCRITRIATGKVTPEALSSCTRCDRV